MVDIPEDLRQLQDFPTYDITFQDSPKFRQNLKHWTFKTDKLAATLTSLADSFERFSKSGLGQYEAAIGLIHGLQEISVQCENNNGNTIAGPLQQFSESLNNIWHFYKEFLCQTELLNIKPIRELANTFNNLKKLNKELLRYRKDYISASERLCAYRNVSKLADIATFDSLAKDCYTAQKTYRMVLSKYVSSLRQAHTQDMISLVRHVVQHFLSLYSHFNFSAQALMELEPSMNDLFTKTKEWQAFYEDELQWWGKMHHSAHQCILAEFQLYVGLCRSQQHVKTTTCAAKIRNRSATHPATSSQRKPAALRPHSSSVVGTVGYHKHEDNERRGLKQVGEASESLDDSSDHHGNTATPEEPAKEAKEAKQVENGILPHARNSPRHLVLQEKGASASPPSSQELSTTSGEKASLIDHPPLASVRPSKGRCHSGISSPVLCKRLLSPESTHLHNMVLSIPERWVQCGYLWLQIKLFNNRYEWIFMYCVVDNSLGQLMIQEQCMPEPHRLENLLQSTTKVCTPDCIDRNYCFKVTTPTSEHIFQTLNDQDLQSWVSALQNTTAEMQKKWSEEHPVQQERGEGEDADVMQDGHIQQCVDSSNTGQQKLVKKLKFHPKQPHKKIKKYIVELAGDQSTDFSRNINDFVSDMRGRTTESHQKMMSEVRTFITSMHSYLLEHHRSDLANCGMDVCDNLERVVETSLQQCIMQPLSHYIYLHIEDYFSQNGHLCQFQRSVTQGKTKSPEEMGIRKLLVVPGKKALAEISRVFQRLTNTYCAISKLEYLLEAVRLIYKNVRHSNNLKNDLGADDFLPLFVWVLVQCDFHRAEIEAEYMWGLAHPSLFTGEAGYYLTTLTTAVNALKEADPPPDPTTSST